MTHPQSPPTVPSAPAPLWCLGIWGDWACVEAGIPVWASDGSSANLHPTRIGQIRSCPVRTRYVVAAFVISITVSPTATSAQDARLETGSQLLRFCRSAITAGDGTVPSGDTWGVEAGLCMGYLLGIGQMYEVAVNRGMASVFCPPITDLFQLLRIVVQYLENNPARLHMAASGLVLSAYESAFPCR